MVSLGSMQIVSQTHYRFCSCKRDVSFLLFYMKHLTCKSFQSSSSSSSSESESGNPSTSKRNVSRSETKATPKESFYLYSHHLQLFSSRPALYTNREYSFLYWSSNPTYVGQAMSWVPVCSSGQRRHYLQADRTKRQICEV